MLENMIFIQNMPSVAQSKYRSAATMNGFMGRYTAITLKNTES